MMTEQLLAALGIYLAIGFLFGIFFVFLGAKKVDPSAVEATWGFKLMIIPGCAIFWPLMAKRWLSGGSLPTEKSAHRKAANS